jgi:hypothetical protein
MANSEPERIRVIIPQDDWADWFEKKVLEAYVPQSVRERIVVMRPEVKEPSTLDEVLTEMLKDPVFRKEWEESERAYSKELGMRRAHHYIPDSPG